MIFHIVVIILIIMVMIKCLGCRKCNHNNSVENFDSTGKPKFTTKMNKKVWEKVFIGKKYQEINSMYKDMRLKIDERLYNLDKKISTLKKEMNDNKNKRGMMGMMDTRDMMGTRDTRDMMDTRDTRDKEDDYKYEMKGLNNEKFYINGLLKLTNQVIKVTNDKKINKEILKNIDEIYRKEYMKILDIRKDIDSTKERKKLGVMSEIITEYINIFTIAVKKYDKHKRDKNTKKMEIDNSIKRMKYDDDLDQSDGSDDLDDSDDVVNSSRRKVKVIDSSPRMTKVIDKRKKSNYIPNDRNYMKKLADKLSNKDTYKEYMNSFMRRR